MNASAEVKRVTGFQIWLLTRATMTGHPNGVEPFGRPIPELVSSRANSGHWPHGWDPRELIYFHLVELAHFRF